jgi:small-conductance mechanosensitive channel
MDTTEMLEQLEFKGDVFSFNLLSILKIPIIFILVGNILFATFLYLRVRILSDTYKTPRNKMVKQIMAIHMIAVVVGTLLSLLFIILT